MCNSGGYCRRRPERASAAGCEGSASRSIPRGVIVSAAGAYGIIRDGSDLLVTEQAAPNRGIPAAGRRHRSRRGTARGRCTARSSRRPAGGSCRGLRRLGAFQRYGYMPEYDRWARKICRVYPAGRWRASARRPRPATGRSGCRSRPPPRCSASRATAISWRDASPGSACPRVGKWARY